MPEIHLWSGLRRFTDGSDVVDVPGTTLGELLAGLERKHPGLQPLLQGGVSVAVNGQIITGGMHDPLPPDAEIFLLQKMKGG